MTRLMFRCTFAAGMLAALFSTQAHGTEILVGTISDGIGVDGRCTLREAVSAANTDTAVNECPAGSGADTILLFFTSDHEITLAGSNEDQNQTGDFDVRDDVTIRPADEGITVVIDAAGLDRVFEVFDGADLTLERIEVRDGDVVGFGGGIFSIEETSTVTLLSSSVTGNRSTLFGGGIYSTGPVLLRDSLVSSNDSSFGGGIYMGSSQPLTLEQSEIRGNNGDADGGGANLLVLRAEGSTIAGNDAGRHGGGVAWRGTGTSGDFSLVTNSTVAENTSAEDGGGIYFDGSGFLELFNTTVAWNAADIFETNAGDGGGIFVADGTVRPRNSIVAANSDLSPGFGATVAPDCVGTLVSLGYNLFSAVDGADCTIAGTTTGNQTGTPASPVDHRLDCLRTESNSTRVVVPMSDSPVIDAGNPAGCIDSTGNSLSTDQRGHLRPWDGPDLDTIARCDIGAVEFGAPDGSYIFGDGFESGNTSAWSNGRRSDAREPAGPNPRGGGCLERRLGARRF